MSSTTRRNFLQYALMGGAALSSRGVPSAIARARAIAPTPGTTWKNAEHIVILMQENRSFDHVFGSLNGVRGFNDPHPLRLSSGYSVFYQPDKKDGHYYAPWRLNLHDTKVTWMGSIPHNRNSQVDAWNHGQYDNWIDAKRPHKKEWTDIPLTMGYYTREDLPFYYAMADAFTVCDQNYCGVMSSTSPNRLLFWTGTVRDKQTINSNVYMRNSEILENGMMTWTTFPQRLEHAGISWGFYQNELSTVANMDDEHEAWLSNFGCNILEYFKAFNVSARDDFPQWVDEKINECKNHIQRLEKQEDLAAGGESPHLIEAQTLLKLLQKRKEMTQPYSALTAEEKRLFNHAFITNKKDKDYHSLETISFKDGQHTQTMKAPKGDILYQFRQDVKTGKLPTVSWLAAPEHFSDHPTSAWYGTWYVSEILNILTENPETWRKTIFIMTYDENDGYFDHCPTYAAPDPTRKETGFSSKKIGEDGLEFSTIDDELSQHVPQKLARSGPIGLGFRVPMIVASPWSRGGWVNSELCDHSSALQFLERFVKEKYGRNLKETNISPWRRAICGDLTSCFHTAEETIPDLPFAQRNQTLEKIEEARSRPLPGGYQRLSKDKLKKIAPHHSFIPQQESGIRPSCALPYSLSCQDGRLTPQGDFELDLYADNTLFKESSAGAPFTICTYNQNNMASCGTYAVAAGDHSHVILPLAKKNKFYDIAIHAPNGFYRLYQGAKTKAILQTSTSYTIGKQAGHHFPKIILTLTLRNTYSQPIRLIIKSYTGKEKESIVDISANSIKKVTFDLTQYKGWYDLALSINNDNDFYQHLAGRIETGYASITDPCIDRK